jgi:hypothetical protein
MMSRGRVARQQVIPVTRDGDAVGRISHKALPSPPPRTKTLRASFTIQYGKYFYFVSMIWKGKKRGFHLELYFSEVEFPYYLTAYKLSNK